jgi:hypothetical protein
MNSKDISNIRTFSQKIAATEFKTVKEIVRWMGAIQAQDFSMAKWAIGLRILDSTDERIEDSFNKGEIIRTHLLRPTWHFISAEDIYWMLELTAPQIKSSMKSRNKELELSESIFTKSKCLLEKTLSNGLSLTRDEIAREYNKVKIRTDGNRLSHLLVRAELDGIVCSGPIKANKQTFSLLQDRVPRKKVLTRDESLVELAKRYFKSRGPATLHDFVWWSGLPVKDARQALESVKSGFITEMIGSEKYLFSTSSPIDIYNKTYIHLLPAFDEFLISYRDRSASLSAGDNKKAVSSNGIFNPLIIINGQVTGLWKRSINKTKVIIEPILLQQLNKTNRNLIEKNAYRFGRFLNKEIEVRYKS